MIEIPCTLRCDGCGETKAVIAVMWARRTPAESDHGRPLTFEITDNILPSNWQVMFGKLRCPRCNGVK